MQLSRQAGEVGRLLRILPWVRPGPEPARRGRLMAVGRVDHQTVPKNRAHQVGRAAKSSSTLGPS